MKNNRKNSKINQIITSHITNNSREYIIISLLFVIGIFLGVLFINNVQEEQFNNISEYINSFIEKFKSIEDIDNLNLLKTSISKNILLAIVLWFFGTTVIRNTSSIWNRSI